MKKRLMLILLMCCWVGITQADLAVTNGDFEADAVQTSNVTDWYDTITATPANWWESTWGGPTVSPNGTSVLGLSYMNTTTNWAYQSIGTGNGRSSLVVSYDVGSFTDAGGARDLGVTISVYESDGSFVPADNTDVDGAAGITLIDSVSTLHAAVAIGAVITDQTVTLDLSTAGSGELFLRFINYAGATGEPWTAIDNVQILTLDAVTLHDPANGESDVAVDLSDRTIANYLSWNAPEDPNIAEIKGYKLYLDPNETDVSNRNDAECDYVASIDGAITQYDPASNFDFLQTLYWVVDTSYTRDDDPNLGTATETVYVGVPTSVWNFETVSAAPIIQTYNSVVVTESMLPASLSAVVTDADGDLASAAFTLLTEDYDYPNPGSYTLTPNVSDPYAPSCTFTADTPGYYKIKLTVSDGTNTVDGRAEVAIYDDPNACAAAQFGPSWGGFNGMDFDQDCDVDLSDFAAFALQWLDDTSLQEPDNYSWYIPFTPVVNGLPNGNFELGDFGDDYYWASDLAVVTDVDPIEGSYSAEWTVDEDGEGIALYMPVKADTSYEFSVQIIGGSNNESDELLVRRQYDFNNPVVEATSWVPDAENVQTVTLSFTTSSDDEGQVYSFVIYGATEGVYYKVDDMRLVEVP